MRSVGLDFGTSTILIAVREGDLPPRILPIGSKTPWIPSVAGVDGKGSIVVGEAAEKLPRDRQIRDLKTEIGESRELDPSFGVRLEDVLVALLAHAVDLGKKRDPSLFGKADRVFVGCPSVWRLGPRKTLSDALKKVGLNVGIADLVEEPIAAGVGWVAEREFEKDAVDLGELLVVDAGGGTLDVAVLGFGDPIEGDVKASRLRIERMFVLATDSLQGSGGNLDQLLADQISKEVAKEESNSLEILDAARTLKESLSTVEVSTVRLPTGKREIKVDRQGFEATIGASIREFVETAVFSCRESFLRFNRIVDIPAVRKSTPSNFGNLKFSIRLEQTKDKESKKVPSGPEPFPGAVLMVGGTALVPKFQQEIRETFDDVRVIIPKNPQEAVVLGLTYSDRVTGFNLPRPPVNIVVQKLMNKDFKPFKTLHVAFDPLHVGQETLKGQTGTGVGFSFEEGTYRIVLQDPFDPQKFSVVADRVLKDKGIFKYYATGDMILRDSTKSDFLRVEGWPETERPLKIVTNGNSDWTEPPYPHK